MRLVTLNYGKSLVTFKLIYKIYMGSKYWEWAAVTDEKGRNCSSETGVELNIYQKNNNKIKLLITNTSRQPQPSPDRISRLPHSHFSICGPAGGIYRTIIYHMYHPYLELRYQTELERKKKSKMPTANSFGTVENTKRRIVASS